MKTKVAKSLVCSHCQRDFVRAYPYIREGQAGVFCSRKCAGHGHAKTFTTPASTPQERRHANWSARYHIEHGKYPVPSTCAKCERERDVEPHHPNYQKPLSVVFLCRSCHMRAHHRADYLNGIPVMEIPAANRPHHGRFKPGHTIRMSRSTRLAAAAKVPTAVRQRIGQEAARSRWGPEAKPQRFYLNTISETHWEIVDRMTGKVHEFIEKTADDDNKDAARKRCKVLNAHVRRGKIS